MDKCYGTLPIDGSRPNNLIEEIGQIQNTPECQWFCKVIYESNCTWFLYDRTTKDCKLFEGSVDDFQNDCNERGYARNPPISECLASFDSGSDHACENFREDYCRFDMDLLDNLEHVQNITHCQMACQHREHCNFFVYGKGDKVCKLQATNFDNRVCDIVHGTHDTDYQSCVGESKIKWFNNATESRQASGHQANPAPAAEIDYEYVGSYGDGVCKNSNGQYPPRCMLNRNNTFPCKEPEEPYVLCQTCQDICDKMPSCIGMGINYYCDQLYFSNYEEAVAQDTAGYCKSWHNQEGAGDISCPDAENNKCGDGTPTNGCYVKKES